MNIEFKKLQIHDFMSFADETVDFAEWKGTTLILGRNNDFSNETNGAGKSTVWSALSYALFGQTPNPMKNEHIVRRLSEDGDMRLVLDFSVDGSPFRIERGMKKRKNSYLSLFAGEKDVTKSTIAETQSFIEENVIRFDFMVFLRTILLTANQDYNFYKMKKAEKKEFVERLFDITVFGDMYAAIHKDSLAVDKSVVAKQNQLLVMNRNVSDYESRVGAFENGRAERVKTAEEAVSAAAARLAEAEATKVSVDGELVEKLKTAGEKLRTAIDDARRSATKFEMEKFSAESEIKRLESVKRHGESAVSKHAELMGRLCNDCRPVFSEYYSLDKYRAEIEKSETAILELSSRMSEAQRGLDSANGSAAELSGKLKLVESKISDGVEKETRHRDLVASLRSRLETAKTEADRRRSEKNPYSELLESANASSAKCADELNTLDRKRKYMKFAESVVSQDTIRKFIIRDLIGILNNKIRKYLVKLGARYYVRFNEDMEYDFIVPDGDCEFGNFSGGESMRLMMATSFAFRDFMSIRNGLVSNILVLDEYFDSAISSACIDSLLRLLGEYAGDGQDVFVITHRLEVQPEQFDNVMTVEKTDGASRVLKTRGGV